MSTGYERIVEFYGDRKANRSGVPLINHINEGLTILDRLDAHPDVKEAFCVHPMIQADEDLKANYFHLINGSGSAKLYLPISANVIGLAMEYRNVANNFLSDQIETGPNSWGATETYSLKPMRLSPLAGVNLMLVADKVQNKKDFELYHLATHDRSRELAYYFDLWLTVLNISPDRYQELIKDL
jgi:hypothetical protein